MVMFRIDDAANRLTSMQYGQVHGRLGLDKLQGKQDRSHMI